MMLIKTMQTYQPAVKVRVTGLIESSAYIVHYFERGVSGYVLAEDAYPLFMQKIRLASRGECLMSPALTQALLNRLCELKQSVDELYGVQAMDPITLYTRLTERECEVLSLIEQGWTNLEISATLYIEPGTVKNHVHNLLDKLGVQTRHQAAILARQVLAPQFVQGRPQAILISKNSESYTTATRL